MNSLRDSHINVFIRHLMMLHNQYCNETGVDIKYVFDLGSTVTVQREEGRQVKREQSKKADGSARSNIKNRATFAYKYISFKVTFRYKS